MDPFFAAADNITPAKFAVLVNLIPEPYATMVSVAVYTGLRVSELVGLKWGRHRQGRDHYRRAFLSG
jgi:integrase